MWVKFNSILQPTSTIKVVPLPPFLYYNLFMWLVAVVDIQEKAERKKLIMKRFVRLSQLKIFTCFLNGNKNNLFETLVSTLPRKVKAKIKRGTKCYYLNKNQIVTIGWNFSSMLHVTVNNKFSRRLEFVTCMVQPNSNLYNLNQLHKIFGDPKEVHYYCPHTENLDMMHTIFIFYSKPTVIRKAFCIHLPLDSSLQGFCLSSPCLSQAFVSIPSPSHPSEPMTNSR